MAYDKLLILDFETTGLDPRIHEIIEIGAILVDHSTLDVHWEHEQKIWPQSIDVASPRALEVNGYDPIRWAEDKAMQFPHAFDAFVARLDHTMVLTGQNVWFDLGFYLEGLKRRELKDPLDPTPHGYSYHRLDVTSMAYPFLKDPVYRLSQLAPALGVGPEPEPHRAINGARRALEIIKTVRARGLHENLPDLTCDVCEMTPKGHEFGCAAAQI
jgi:DNA polymerase III epsilon subunit-like protein